jgi:hypothetical protein
LINNVHGPPVDGRVQGRQLGTGKPEDRGRVGGLGCAQRAAGGCKRGRTRIVEFPREGRPEGAPGESWALWVGADGSPAP